MNTDKTIQQDVQDELNWEPTLRGSQIGVTVQEGVVTLTGTTQTYQQKWTADRVAKRVYGVNGVADEIEVDLPVQHRRTDADMAAAALHALAWNVLVPDEQIQVTVSDGWVTLDGQVDWRYEKEAAAQVVQQLTGVRGITNLISVKPQLASDDLKQRIERAFQRHADLDAKRIQVDVRDRQVVLRGRVRSWVEREEAEQAVWSAPGITTVEDHLVVMP